MQRPLGDFINDDEFNETVHCDDCDEELIKMFVNDHVCDQAKLQAMVANSRG